MPSSLNGAGGRPATPADPDGLDRHEPLAIIGIGCRLPGGANDPSSFWGLLADGVDAISEVPVERWSTRAFHDPAPGKPGKTQARWGGFLPDVDRFDPHFFGISPREAARMDPQQRLLLEVAWEALEDGGLPLESLAGRRVAVFVGISSWDYAVLQSSFRDRGLIDVYSNTGNTLSIAANRVSYCFDFRGPSAAVDTACSSALVAVHLACRSIWEDGCPLALAGGVNALLLPDSFVGFSRMGMLSPDGRCRAFDARGNGFVRSEGAGVVVLKPLARALADGDRVYAVIRGAAVNQDGRTPGLTVPNEASQAALLREACRSAGVAPASIQFVEAHGPGTPVGDPIEARALGQVLGEGRPADRPCVVGSVKTNIGHLEAGAGIAGLIKTALALHHRLVPGNLHFEQPHPDIDFQALRLRVPVHCEPWPAGEGPRLAGVNSFGFGGTNAHVVLQEAPPDDKVTGWQGDKVTEDRGEPVALPPCHLVTLSARSPEALRAAAAALRDLVRDRAAGASLHDIAANAARRRTHHEHRLGVVAASTEHLARSLDLFAAGQPAAGVCSGRAGGPTPRLAFVCSGQGPQWWAMGRQLLTEEPVFAEMIRRCDAIVRRLGPWSLLEELTADEARSRMAQTAISQPALFALQVALAGLWQAWGVRPEAVVGHSVGEVAAAYLAGVFSLEDAVRVIYQRGRCMDRASSRGRMLAASISAAEARDLVAEHGDAVSLAAVNGPASVTLSGEAEPVEAIATQLEQRGVFCRLLAVQYAFHSAQMGPVRDELLASLAGIRPRPATLPLFSTVTGRRVAGPELGPEYWWRNVRQMVQFVSGVEQLRALGCDAVVELSPHPVLGSAVVECYRRHGQGVKVLPSLRRREPERATLLGSLAALHVQGYPIDWDGVLPGPYRFVRLPSYPWQHERCWFEPEESRVTRLAAPAHPLLGRSLDDARPAWEARLDLRLFPALGDHRVRHSAIVPATAYIELALAAARAAFGPGGYQLEDVRLSNPCLLCADRPLRLQTLFHPADGAVQIHSRAAVGQQEWTAHASAVVRPISPDASPPLDSDAVRRRCRREYTPAACYVYLGRMGLDYGPLFQGIECAWQGDRESLGIVRLPEGLTAEAADYLFHPALLDACFQMVVVADRHFDRVVSGLYLPVEIEQVRLYRAAPRRVWAHARLRERTARRSVADIDIYDESGLPVAEVRGLHSQRVAGGAEESLDALLHGYEWQCQPAGERGASCGADRVDRWLIFADRGGVAEAAALQMGAGGAHCALVSPGNASERRGPERYVINAGSRDDMVRLIETVLPPGQPGRPGILHLWNLDAPSAEELTPADLEEAQETGLLSVLYLVQAWEEVRRRAGDAASVATDPAPPLFLVTRGAQSVGAEPRAVALAQTPVLGLGRVISNECPALRCRLVDLGLTEDACRALLEEVAIADDEDEVAWRGSARHVHRFVAVKPPGSVPQSATGPYRVANRSRGNLDGVTLETMQRQPPGPGEVEIEVDAAGVNFSDLMKALGIYPGLPDGEAPLGAECSGRVTAVGPGVDGLRVGDEVVAVAPRAFASHVVTRAELTAPKPPSLSFEEAATLPIAFLTAAYGLEELAHLTAGERVLIHSASGGVGLAAVQLALRAGAEIYATAGTPQKRAFLEGLGVAAVMGSRSTAFADEVLQRTGGRGVDVVLNSLAGAGLARSLDVLAEYGRFLEIGKRDIYQNTRLGLRPFRKGLSFFAIDLDRMMRERPALVGALLGRLVGEVRDGRLTPLPHRAFPVADVAAALRHMQQGKHIGKIVLTMRERPAAVMPGGDPVRFRADATYLVTGGLGGFGLAVADWLVEHGARNLVLLGRRGAHSAESRQAVAELERRGARVVVRAADVACEADVAAVFQEIDRTLPPLRGVLHAAMVLEDCLLLNLDRDRMGRVLAPKVRGAWRLHTLTRDRPLDFFVLFSSLSSVFGHAGQANYAAANAFLDALAHHRRAIGLPALTVNWGYLGDVGYLAERPQLGERLERQGLRSFTASQALTLLGRALRRSMVQVSVLRIDWSRWRGLGVAGRVSPRFAHLLRAAAASGDTATDGPPTAEAVRAADPAKRRDLLDAWLRDKVARALGTEAARLEADKSLLSLGLDSLMAVELRNWVEGELHLNLPIAELLRSPSLSHLADLLLAQLGPGASGNGQPRAAQSEHRPSPAPAAPVIDVKKLSGAEIDTLVEALRGE